MSDIIATARSARETLARGLNALQADANAPQSFLQAAEPIAMAMGALHRIERSGGAELATAAPQALDAVRQALGMLQVQSSSDTRMMEVLEMVAGSLGMVFSLTKAAKYGPAPQPAAQPQPQQQPYAPPPAAQPQPQAYAPAPQQYAAPQPAPQQYQQPQVQQPAYQQPAPQQPVYQQPQPVYQQPPQQAYQPQPQAQPYQQQPAYQQPAPQQPAYQPQPAYQQPAPQQPAYQPQPAPQQPAYAVQGDPFAAPPAHQAPPWGAAPPQQPMQARPDTGGQPVMSQHPATPDEVRNAKLPLVEAELGTHSASNFYKGLSGNDVVDNGGLFVSTYNIPQIGQSLKLRVSMPGGYEFEALGVVRWTREARESMTSDISPPGFGVQFTTITPEARNLVYRYVRNREPIFHDDL